MTQITAFPIVGRKPSELPSASSAATTATVAITQSGVTEKATIAQILANVPTPTSDAVLLNRSNHTGTQPVSTLSDFSSASTTIANASASTAVGNHVAASDPHTQYLTQARGDARYVRTVNGTAPDGAGNVAVAGGGGAGTTNLTTTTGASTVIIVSDTGTDATIPAATNTTAGVATAAQIGKLEGIATGATANAADAALRDRTTHTGQQTSGTISDFTEASQDVIGAMIVAAGGTYDDSAGTITLPSGGTVADATTSVKGIVQLTGALGGTATAPTALGYANAAALTAALALKADLAPTVETVSATTYTVVAGDSGKIKRFTSPSAVTITVPSGLGSITSTFVRGGTGSLTFVAGSGVTLNASSLVVNNQYTAASLAPTGTANVFDLMGALGDFTEDVQDIIGAMVTAAGGSYNDSAGTITLPGSGTGVTDGDKGDIVVSGTGATWTIDSAVLSTFGRTLTDDADAATARTTLGLGTMATQASTAYAPATSTEEVTATTYTVVAGDNGKIKRFTSASAVTVTVPSGLGTAFGCTFVRAGAGSVTFSASGTTLNSNAGSLAIPAQYAGAILTPSATANTFDLMFISDGSGGGDVTTTGTQTLTNKTLTAPVINGGTAAAITSFGLRNAGTGAFDMQPAHNGTLTANRALTWNLNDAARTISMAGNLTLAGGLTTAGSFATTFTMTAATSVTFPTSGTLATQAEARQETICVCVSDETTALTTGTNKVRFRMPFAMTGVSVRASLSTASSSGLPTVDIKENGTTIFSTLLSIDATEKTSTTAATAAVLSDTSLADDAEISIDITVAGTGATGLKVYLTGTR